VTNHAVVAMIDDLVKQTRCTTCDAEHEYKEARVPAVRRKKDAVADAATVLARTGLPQADESGDDLDDTLPDPTGADSTEQMADAMAVAEAAASDDDPPAIPDGAPDDEGPVHRRLIRATLPRPEGQVPEWKEPEFTVRQPGGRGGREADGNRNGHGGHGGQGAPGQRPGRHRRPMRAGGGQGNPGGVSRFGGPRRGGPGGGPGGGQGGPGQGGHGQGGHGQRPPGGGNRPGGGGSNRGPGRKRGR
jgi:hypothetical protein